MRKLTAKARATFWCVLGVLGAAIGCSATSDREDAGGQGARSGGGTRSSQPDLAGTGGTGVTINVTGGSGGITGTGGACASITRTAQPRRGPVDVLFMIDNSESMADKIASVRERINRDFVDIINASGVDYRVVMLSRYGETEANAVCIPSPLGGTDCTAPDTQALKNGERYFQYSVDIASLDGWCKMLDSFSRPDEFDYTDYYPDEPLVRPWTPLAPNGWQQYLRPSTFKSFVLITDDESFCSTMEQGAYASETKQFDAEHSDATVAAAKFDEALLKLSPEFFGSKEKRNYRVHSIVGLNAAGTVPSTDPLINETCGTSSAAGLGHQALSLLTGGLRFPICEYEKYGEVFNALASDTIESAELACDWAIPAPPSGSVFDSTKINVEYRPGTGNASEVLGNVPSAADCGTQQGWYYDDAAKPTKVMACPATCTALKADVEGAVDIAFGCETIVRVK